MKLNSLIFLIIFPLTGMAGNDPSIKGNLRSNIQSAMNQFIDNQAVNGKIKHYDAIADQVLELKIVKLHSGIVKKGDFYVSCADFVDQKGRKIDMDFMVIKKGSSLVASQALVHSIDGKKRKYHLEK